MVLYFEYTIIMCFITIYINVGIDLLVSIHSIESLSIATLHMFNLEQSFSYSKKKIKLALVGGARSITHVAKFPFHVAKFPFTCSFLCDGK